MDYEKRYKEALERARKFYNELAACRTKQKVAVIFPELTESEDERVRKFLLDYAIEMIAGLESDISLSTYDGIKGHDPDAEEELNQWQKARAYLEKQKEQKPVEEQFPPLEGLDAIKAEYYDKGFKNGFDEGVDSVKPAEWSEEDEKMIERLITRLNWITYNTRTNGTSPNITFFDEIEWLKSLRLRPSWKPSEQ